MPDRDREMPLGGLITAAVRAGDTVRRPAAPGTEAVAALLTHLESAGFDGAPRYWGPPAAGGTPRCARLRILVGPPLPSGAVSDVDGRAPGRARRRWACARRCGKRRLGGRGVR